uniref:Uncharacterized protein n=1 Tax=Gallus gallus TaxID=9031 RepID=A0A8V1ANV2_CHICK
SSFPSSFFPLPFPLFPPCSISSAFPNHAHIHSTTPCLPYPPRTPVTPPRRPTGDLHDVILSLHHQLLRSKVVDVQGDLPAVGALPDLGDAAAQLPAQRPAVGRPRGRQQGALAGQQTEVSGPGAAAGPLVPILGDVRHPEGLVEEAAAMVPVAEGLPAGAGEEGEGHAALGHGARGGGAERL